MTIRLTPSGHAFPDPDAIMTDHNLIRRTWLQAPVSVPLPPVAPEPEPVALRLSTGE